MSSLDIAFNDCRPLLMLEDGELDVDDDRAKSDNDVDRDGRLGCVSVINRSLDDDMDGSTAELIDLTFTSVRRHCDCTGGLSSIVVDAKEGVRGEGRLWPLRLLRAMPLLPDIGNHQLYNAIILFGGTRKACVPTTPNTLSSSSMKGFNSTLEWTTRK